MNQNNNTNLVTSVINGQQPAFNNQTTANKAIMTSVIHRQKMTANLKQQDSSVKPEEFIVTNNQGLKSVYFANPNTQQFIMQPTNLNITQNTIRQSLIVKEGYLLKESPHYLQGFQNRFCKLVNRVFYYYRPEQLNVPYGVLNFDVQTYNYSDKKDKQQHIIEFTLIPLKGTKVFKFKAEQDTHGWALAVQEHLKESLGHQKQLAKLVTIPRFWRYERLSHQQVQEDLKDGDIVLFKGYDFVSKAQRAVTGSEYDHVAIVFIRNEEPWVFEAVQEGVGGFRWIQMKAQGWGKLYEKVCIRKLDVVRDNWFKLTLNNFVDEQQGKEYSCSLAKLTKFTSTVKQPGEKDDPNRTFFCSELVAAAYKKLNLLPQEKSSCQYYPVDFSCDKSVVLLGNAKLSAEYLVDFGDD